MRTIIPNKKIDYFKTFTGKNLWEFNAQGDEKILIKGYSIGDLRFSTLQLKFRNANNEYFFNEIIKTVLPDGSSIDRTNPQRKQHYTDFPSQVWFDFKENLPYNKRIKYIKYELLRTLCYIYPHDSGYRLYSSKLGVFSTSSYIPDIAEFNNLDEILLQKLYEEDFLKHFRDYLTTAYSWRYANNFLNKDLAKMIAWIVIICIGLFVFLLSFPFFQSKKFKFSFLSYFLPLLFIMVYSLNLTLIYSYLTDLGTNQNFRFESILGDYLVVFIGSLIISFPLWLLEKIWINKIKDFSFQLICKVIFTFITFNIPIGIMYIKYPPSTSYDGFIEFYLPVFIITIVIAMSRGLLLYLNHYSDSLVKEKEVELSRLKEVNAQSELKLLQSHINPHFLYNALNSIAGLAHNNPDKTEKMALSLSNLFRYSINKKGQKWSTVKEEVLMVENYLEIEKIRFGKRLNFTLLIDETIENEPIPMYILQPLVENAIKHGISEIRGEGFITLEIKKEAETLYIIVSDNGPDFPSSLVSGHGLQTVYDLLRLSYGDKAALKWENNPKKHIVISITQTV